MALSFRFRFQGTMMMIGGLAGLLIFKAGMKQLHEIEAADARAAAEAAKAAALAHPAPAAPTVVALWTGQPIPGEPLGVHVADVGVDAAGALTLLLADNAATRASVEAALAEARARPALEVAASTSAPAGTPPAQARPGEPRYIDAVAQFLSKKTGFKPQLER